MPRREQPAAGDDITVNRVTSVEVITRYLKIDRNPNNNGFINIKNKTRRVAEHDPWAEIQLDIRLIDEVINGLIRYKGALDETT